MGRKLADSRLRVNLPLIVVHRICEANQSYGDGLAD
jgi:hypothetical protein